MPGLRGTRGASRAFGIFVNGLWARLDFSRGLLLAIIGLISSAQGAAPIRVMLLDGESAGTYHDWRAITPILKRDLEETGLFQVDVVTAPPSTSGLAGFNPDFSKYQVVVFNYDAPDWPEALKASFEQYMKNGGGMVSVHAADNAFPAWKGWNEMIGIGGWRNRTETAGPLWYYRDGKLVSDTTPGHAGSHGKRLPFQVTTRDPDHPIMKGLPPVWMHAGDELYATLRGPGANMTVLATAHSETSNSGTGRDESILMVLNYGKGRIFHTTLGHDIPALNCIGFITTFQRGTEWAATGKVTQKVPPNFPAADKVSTRE
ncbi:MAG TPA: ThuA domain-containing protein [Bryobacteraceae bacterium]|nr:ThuA domain-containing protein [Bryobacteraceae bacterium]